MTCGACVAFGLRRTRQRNLARQSNRPVACTSPPDLCGLPRRCSGARRRRAADYTCRLHGADAASARASIAATLSARASSRASRSSRATWSPRRQLQLRQTRPWLAGQTSQPRSTSTSRTSLPKDASSPRLARRPRRSARRTASTPGTCDLILTAYLPEP